MLPVGWRKVSILEAKEAEPLFVLCYRDDWNEKWVLVGGETFSWWQLLTKNTLQPSPKSERETRNQSSDWRVSGSRKPGRSSKTCPSPNMHALGCLLHLPRGMLFNSHQFVLWVNCPPIYRLGPKLLPFQPRSTVLASQEAATYPRLDQPWTFQVEAVLARGRRKQCLDYLLGWATLA